MKLAGTKTVLFIVAFAVLCCAASVAQACPTCKDGLANDQSNMVQAYFWSILFMMSMPFLIFSGLGGYFYYLIVKARADRAAGDALSALTTDTGFVRNGALVAVGVPLDV